MIVGNIITSSNIEEEDFKICRKLETIDESLPTIIVGWDKTKELFEDEVSILHKQIEENLYWTFSEKERKIDYEIDILKFKEICYENFGEDIIYLYVDIIHGRLSTIKKILKKIYSLEESISYITDKNMLYIFGDNLIFGVDLNITNFMGIKNEKIIDRLATLPNSVLIENEIFNKCKEFIKKLDNRYRLVPYIIKYGRYI
tara:strand:- start:2419 stop:3021 length:603 start_codon:yes stop_codon:yes gene_type:complete